MSFTYYGEVEVLYRVRDCSHRKRLIRDAALSSVGDILHTHSPVRSPIHDIIMLIYFIIY